MKTKSVNSRAPLFGNAGGGHAVSRTESFFRRMKEKLTVQNKHKPCQALLTVRPPFWRPGVQLSETFQDITKPFPQVKPALPDMTKPSKDLMQRRPDLWRSLRYLTKAFPYLWKPFPYLWKRFRQVRKACHT